MNYWRFTLLFGVLLVLGPVGLQAQEPSGEMEYTDVLYLKNGSVLKGKLLRYVHGQHLLFQLETGDQLEVRQVDIKKLVQGGQAAPSEYRDQGAPPAYTFREKGGYNAVHLSAAIGRNHHNESAVAPGASIATGYQFSRLLGLGAGVGVDAYHPSLSEIAYPVFGEVRGYFRERNRSPYYALRVGYGVVFKDEDRNITEAEGGLFFHPAIGIRWGAAEDLNFVSDFGFQYQRASYTTPFSQVGEQEVEVKQYKRLTLRIGLVF